MFSAPPIDFFVIVKDHSLEIYSTEDTSFVQQLAFPPELIDNLEIIDTQRLQQHIVQFVESLQIAQKNVVIILDSELVFPQFISSTTGTDQAKILATFTSTLPFDPEKKEVKVVVDEQGLKLFGTNSEIYTLVKSVFEDQKNRVIVVVPSQLFSDVLGNDVQLTVEAMASVMKQQKMVKKYAFDGHSVAKKKEQPHSKDQVQQSDHRGPNRVLITAFLLILPICVVVILLMLRQQSVPQKHQGAPLVASSSSSL